MIELVLPGADKNPLHKSEGILSGSTEKFQGLPVVAGVVAVTKIDVS
jgi:hypothetical protein